MGNIRYILKRLKTMDKKAMKETIDTIHKQTGKSKFSIFMDMQKCARRYGAGYMDYYLLEFYDKTDEQRNTYITRGRNNDLYRKYCDMEELHYFVNKDEFNERFKTYMNRDWIKVNGTSKEEIIDFFKKHDVFMAKPIDGCSGKGIEKLKASTYPSYDELYQYLTREGSNYELEEIIEQNEEMSRIYPDSINTIRVVTIVTTEDNKSLLTIPKEKRKDTKVVSHIICTSCRIGNGKCVDNFNSGGMVVPVDEKTGKINQCAMDAEKKVYENHPITGTPIKGFQIPYWKEVIDLCTRASYEVPEVGYVGWDVAITPNGPVFVEGNELPSYDLYQMPIHTPNKIGVMPKFDLEHKIV